MDSIDINRLDMCEEDRVVPNESATAVRTDFHLLLSLSLLLIMLLESLIGLIMLFT